jgi:upstream activation factor subunit UAF30
MELLYIALAVCGFILAFKLGRDAGREEILVSQSNAIDNALSDQDSEFYQRIRLHGMYVLPGHENRWPPNYVVIKHSDLLERLDPNRHELPDVGSSETQEQSVEVEEPDEDDASLMARGPLFSPSAALEKITGPGPLHQVMAIRRVWAYIEKHSLQDAERKAMINCDEALEAVVGGAQVSMFVLAKRISPHLSPSAA